MAFVGAAAMEIWPKEASAAVGEFTSAFFFSSVIFGWRFKGRSLLPRGGGFQEGSLGGRQSWGFCFIIVNKSLYSTLFGRKDIFNEMQVRIYDVAGKSKCSNLICSPTQGSGLAVIQVHLYCIDSPSCQADLKPIGTRSSQNHSG